MIIVAVIFPLRFGLRILQRGSFTRRGSEEQPNQDSYKTQSYPGPKVKIST